MSEKVKKNIFKEILKFILITTSVICILGVGIFAIGVFHFNVNSISLIKSINQINSFKEDDLILSNKYSDSDLQNINLKLNNPSFSNNILYLTDKEIASYLNTQEIEFLYNSKLKELTFSNYESTNILTRLEFVLDLNIEEIKNYKLTEFPANIISMNLPNNLYLKITVDITKSGEEISILYKSIQINNLSTTDTENVFRFFTVFAQDLNAEQISISLADTILNSIIGTNSIYSNLKSYGAKYFDFREFNGQNCIAIYNTNQSINPPIIENTYFNIIYNNTKGATNQNPDSYKITDNEISLMPISLNGYDFLCWLDENNSPITSINPGLAKNISLTAQWQTISYSISYDLKGGIISSPNPTNYNIETNSFTLNNPTKAGYSFLGWSSLSLSKITDNAEIPQGSYGNLSFTAVFIKQIYNISYNNTKNAENINPASYTITDNIIHLTNLSQNGYNFIGWLDENNNPISSIDPNLTKDITLNAQWQLISYTITYDLSGGSISSANQTTYNVETPSFTLNNPTKINDTFYGWSSTYLDSIIDTVIIKTGTYGDLYFTAIFTSLINNTFNITYENTKGATNPNPSSYNSNSNHIVLSNLSLNGYNFIGWLDENNNPISSIDPNWAKNITLTAQWQITDYSITYNLNGGSLPSANPTSYNIETNTFILINPTKLGYTFLGWSSSSSSKITDTAKINKGSYGNLTFTAVFVKETYYITYTNTKGATNSNPISYTITDNLITLTSLSLNGYDFVGWFDEYNNPISLIDSSIVNDITLNAQWQLKNYTITYNLNDGSLSSANKTSYNIETDSFTLNIIRSFISRR